MRNNYEYIDPDYTYTDPKTEGGLRNLANVTDPDSLLFFENVAVIKQARELEAQPIIMRNADTLCDIHCHLFQDVYHWAGQKRTVELKHGKPFFLTAYFNKGFTYINTLISEYRKIDPVHKPNLAESLSILLVSNRSVSGY